jgi:HD-GYP domain-containing protein (c-di-GMP phosphodiesterase class II)
MHNPRPQAIKEAKDIVNRLAIILKIGQTYSADNEAVVKAVDAFVEMITPLLRSEKSIAIELLGEYFHLNESRIRYTVQYYVNFDFLMGEFRKRGLGSITFNDTISRRDLQDFLRAFLSCLSSDSPFVTLKGAVETIETIAIGGLKLAQEGNIIDKRHTLRRTYFNAVSHLKAVVGRVRGGENVDIKKARLVVNSLVDLILQEEQMLISMAAIKDYDEYTYHHSVNVSILSIALGMKLGFNKKKLSELGIAAFLHDIGKVTIPDNILNKPSSFDNNEWEIMRRHPEEGVKKILGIMKMDALTIRSAIVAYEHHLNYDGSGYPDVRRSRQSDFYSNIVTIADRFDAMTSARVYSRIPKPPEEALHILLQSAGTDVDPTLVKMFIKMIGVFPIGTFVALDTRELGVVYRGNSEQPDRPIIALVVDSQGQRVENTLVDLTDRGLDGRYRRTIQKTLDSNKYDINLSEYLLEAYA